MEHTIFMGLLLAYYVVPKIIFDLRVRVACVKRSIPEARWLCFRHKVTVQSDAKIRGLDAAILQNQIFISFEASSLPLAELNALLGDRTFKGPI